MLLRMIKMNMKRLIVSITAIPRSVFKSVGLILRWLCAILRWLSPLLVDGRSNRISLGRVAFWAILIVSLYHFAAFSAHWLTLLMAVLAYCLTGKWLGGSKSKPADD